MDDRAENLRALETILDLPDYRLVTAQSGRDALEKVVREDFAVILLDVAMPEMSGFEVADRLKQDERTRHIPILFLTAIAVGLEEIYRAYRIGAVDYLIKPLDVNAVRAKVAVFADLYRQRRAIELRDRRLLEAQQREHAVRIAQLRSATDERFQKLVDGIDSAFGWTADAEARRLSFVSRRVNEVLGYSESELLREGFLLDHVHPDDRESTARMFATVVEQRCDQTMTHRLIAADGSTRWYHTGVSAGVNPDTLRLELHGISVDVSDLKEAEERQQILASENSRLYWRAAHAARTRDELLHIVAHELKSPLGSMLICIASARAGLANGEDVAQAAASLDRAERAGRMMKRLVSDLVDLELLKTGRLSMNKQRHDVAALVADAIMPVAPLARARSIDLRVEAPGMAGFGLYCDRDRLLQVLSNLLDNAVTFSPPAGTIVLAVGCDDGAVRFSVSDEGPGIEAAKLRHIFEHLWRGKGAAREGLALGLRIAGALVHAHDGRIWAESAPGKGSTFFFTVPTCEVCEASTTSKSLPRSPAEHAPRGL